MSDDSWITEPFDGTGIGPSFLADTTSKRGPGKPFAEARLRRIRIAAYVQELMRAKPGAKVDEEIVEAARQFFGVKSRRTVWNALRQDREFGWLISLGSIGPLTTWSTADYTAPTDDDQ
jgi:hypothetical protein